jgi:hypothetical protein
MMGTRPQTIGYAINDSPTGLAAWMLGHPGFSRWTYDNSDPEKSPDEVLDDITLYWLTNSATSAGRLYWEYGGRSVVFAAVERTLEIALPVAITVFPEETYLAPETWARRAYPNLIYFHEVHSQQVKAKEIDMSSTSLTHSEDPQHHVPGCSGNRSSAC